MRILVADDHELFLKGLEFILSDVSKDLQLVLPRVIPIFSKFSRPTAVSIWC